MGLWDPKHGDRKSDKTPLFIEKADDFLLLNLKHPCIIVLPPHCLHSVFTLKPSLHIGTRAASTLWYEQMETVVSTWTLEANRKFVEKRVPLSTTLWNELHTDLILWFLLLEEKRGSSGDKEDQVMDLLMRLMEPMDGFLKTKIRSL